MAAHEYRNLISFVRGKSDEEGLSEQKNSKQNQLLTGEEARSFYESVISEESGDGNEQKGGNSCFRGSEKRISDKEFSKSSSARIKLDLKEKGELKHSQREFPQTVPVGRHQTLTLGSTTEQSYRQGMAMLRCAEHGDDKEMKRHLETGVSVDFQDSFGWTALMCAAVAGQVQAVKQLLAAGADASIVNNQQKKALQLARDAHKKDVVDTLLKWKHPTEPSHRLLTTDNVKQEKFFCKICGQEFSDGSEKSHRSSTVHLFNMKLKPKPDPFMIPASNVGFKLMRKSGWDGEKGLGPSGTGLKFPVKTVLKRDRACLGSDSDKEKMKKARITHFGPNDASAVRSAHLCTKRVESAKTLSKRARLKKEKKEKEWERNLRQYMNTD